MKLPTGQIHYSLPGFVFIGTLLLSAYEVKIICKSTGHFSRKLKWPFFILTEAGKLLPNVQIKTEIDVTVNNRIGDG